MDAQDAHLCVVTSRSQRHMSVCANRCNSHLMTHTHCLCSTRQVAKSKQKKAPAEEVHVAWKGGLAQQRAAQEAAQRAAAEARKAFGRCACAWACVCVVCARGRDASPCTHVACSC
jgi:hypothetical protein